MHSYLQSAYYSIEPENDKAASIAHKNKDASGVPGAFFWRRDRVRPQRDRWFV